jgi:small subunit ribosomal protein S1
LAIDVEKERISLGVKQLDGDPWSNFVATNDKGSVVQGKVKSVDAKGAVVELAQDVEAYLRASELSRDRVQDASTVLKEGEEITAVIINVDRKTRNINLSVKARDAADEAAAMQRLQSDASTGTTNLGALLKAQLNKN